MNLNPSPRDRIAELVIVVACAAGAWWMAAKPFHDRAQLAQARLQDVRTQLAAASVVRADDPDRAAAIMDTVARWSAERADPLLVSDLLQQAADESTVHIERLSPTDDEITNAFGALAMVTRNFELIATGSARSVMHFLDAVDGRPLIVVQSFELAPGTNNGDVVALVHIEVARISMADAAGNGAGQ